MSKLSQITMFQLIQSHHTELPLPLHPNEKVSHTHPHNIHHPTLTPHASVVRYSKYTKYGSSGDATSFQQFNTLLYAVLQPSDAENSGARIIMLSLQKSSNYK